MDTGIGYFPTHDAMGPGDVARLVEQHGHNALYFAEHTHIPASRETPYVGGGELPRKYAHTYDLFVALTAAAVATSHLRVGSGICLVVERDPIITAKEVASVDHLSGGRFEFGVGAGWNREEMANHGTDPRTRMKLLAERVEAMKAIWTQDEASYAGEHVAFERIWSWPKPAQRPDRAGPGAGLGRRLVPAVARQGPLRPDRRAALARGPADRGAGAQRAAGPQGARTTGERGRAAGRVLAAVRAVERGRAGLGEVGSGDRRPHRPVKQPRPADPLHGRLQDRFANARVAHLATVGDTGAPHLVPIVFALVGDVIHSAVDGKPKRHTALRRLANIAHEPRVSVLADHYDDD